VNQRVESISINVDADVNADVNAHVNAAVLDSFIEEKLAQRCGSQLITAVNSSRFPLYFQRDGSQQRASGSA
jgi:hypothetical protein